MARRQGTRRPSHHSSLIAHRSSLIMFSQKQNQGVNRAIPSPRVLRRVLFCLALTLLPSGKKDL